MIPYTIFGRKGMLISAVRLYAEISHLSFFTVQSVQIKSHLRKSFQETLRTGSFKRPPRIEHKYLIRKKKNPSNFNSNLPQANPVQWLLDWRPLMYLLYKMHYILGTMIGIGESTFPEAVRRCKLPEGAKNQQILRWTYSGLPLIQNVVAVVANERLSRHHIKVQLHATRGNPRARDGAATTTFTTVTALWSLSTLKWGLSTRKCANFG